MVRTTFWAELGMALLILLYSSAQAHSTLNHPLSRVESLPQPSIHILPRSSQQEETFLHRRSWVPPLLQPDHSILRSTDTFRLILTAYNTTFHLHLTPNDALIHPNAQFTYVDENNIATVQWLEQDEFRIYKGDVVESAYSDERLLEDEVGIVREEWQVDHRVVGWARIFVHENKGDSAKQLFEGAFTYHGDLYHVRTMEGFRRTKRLEDPMPSWSEEEDSLIIYRDSDLVYAPTSTFEKRDVQEPVCGMEDLVYNVIPSNPIRRMKSDNINNINSSGPRLNHALSARSFDGIGWENGWGMNSLISERQSSLLAAFHKGQDTSLFKRGINGCPTSRLINYMGAAADCTYTSFYQTVQNARTQIIIDWNTASGVYERSFNISLGLIDLEVRSSTCPTVQQRAVNETWNQQCSDQYTIDQRLSDFSYWRGGRGDDGTGLWHLMTSCATGARVGIAWLGQLCQTDAQMHTTDNGAIQYVSGTAVSSITRDEWKVVAHEIGHGFGAVHDCTAALCPCVGDCGCCPLSSSQCDAGGTYIMNPTSNVSTNDFSPCSIMDICSFFPNIGYCLEPPGGRQIETFNICGNGIREGNEECDNGGIDTACCNGSNCTLTPFSTCDDATDACCQNCTFKSSNAICRPAVSSCDIPEYCTGNNRTCPPDKYLNDGTSCSGSLTCASGQCTSRDVQCAIRGSRLNITTQCSFQSSSCQISCADPADSRNCLQLSGFFLDGTPCGYGGSCERGTCQSNGFGAFLTSLVAQNLKIAIPVIIIIGGIILLALWHVFLLCVRSLRRRKLLAKHSSAYSNGTAPGIWIDAAGFNLPMPPISHARDTPSSGPSSVSSPYGSAFPVSSWAQSPALATARSENSFLLSNREQNSVTPLGSALSRQRLNAGVMNSSSPECGVLYDVGLHSPPTFPRQDELRKTVFGQRGKEGV